MPKLTDIEGIRPAYVRKLEKAGVKSTGSLLKLAGGRTERKKLVATTGLSEGLLIGWVSRANLMEVKGIGTQYVNLLAAAGVDTLPELANRNPLELHAEIAREAREKNIVRRVPSQDTVQQWIDGARQIKQIRSSLPGDETTDAPPPKRRLVEY